LKRSLFFLFILATSCTTFFKNQNERVIAKVFDEYLYESDLIGLVPPGTASKDSIAMSKGYVDNWVCQQLLIHQARKNLTKDQLDFSSQLENYQNSLIIYTFENALIRQNLDTLVTEEEMQSYYEQNQQSFLLKENIVQFQFLKLPLKTPNVGQFKKLLCSGSQEDQTRLSEMCEKQAADYFLDDQNWLLFSDLLKQIPIKTYNQEDFLKNHREFEFQDSVYHYLVRFKDFKIKESVSPYAFEKRRLHDILLNKRKMDLIKKMQEDIYTSARKNNDFEIY
jgi:hypothetical protein